MPHNIGLPLGVGFLRIDAGQHRWEWHRHIRLPLFRDPSQSGPVGWIADGWLIDLEDESVQPFGTTGLLETEYEASSAIVYEMRPDGWIRFRYLPEENGTAWTHECFFDRGADPVSVTTGEDRLTSDQVSSLFFRNAVPFHAGMLRHPPMAASDHDLNVPSHDFL